MWSIVDRIGGYLVGAAVLFTFALIMLLTILLSPGEEQWWLHVQTVQGTEHAGVVSYSYRNQIYTLPDPSSVTRTGRRTVYLTANDPADARLTDWAKLATDWAVTGGPAVVGLFLVALGVVRRYQVRGHQRDAAENPDGFGRGITMR